MSSEHLFTCRVSSREAGLTLVEALSSRFPYFSEEQWRRLLLAGDISVNGCLPAPEQLLILNDQIQTTISGLDEPAGPQTINTLYADEDFLLVEKPAGTPVSRTGRIIHHTAINILRRQYDSEDIQLMHRLDLETSGLLLCARTRKSCKRYQQHLPDLIVRKFYLAVVRGDLQVHNLQVSFPLAEQEGSAVRCQMHVVVGGKETATTLHTLAVNKDSSLLLVELHTGRKHQIRAHLAHLGHPLFGDKIYSFAGKYFLTRLQRELNEADYQVLGAAQHTLHAWGMELHLPKGPPAMFFAEGFSTDMARWLDLFPPWQPAAQQGLIDLGVTPALLAE